MDASHHHSGQHEAQLTIVMSRQTGLLGQLVAFLGRQHVTFAKQRTTDTGASDHVIVTLTVMIEPQRLPELALALEAIDGVLKVEAQPIDVTAPVKVSLPMSPTEALNQNLTSSISLQGEELVEALCSHIETVIGKFYHLDTQQFAYESWATSDPDIADHCRLLGALKKTDLSLLNAHSVRLAFWLNVFNLLCLHGIVAHQLKSSLRDVKDFFNRTGYIIGGFTLTLDDIEHGILRGNARKFWGLSNTFSQTDKRSALSLSQLEPRVHFAFYSGCISSPRLRAYHSAHIDEQLRHATRDYLAQHVTLNEDGTTCRIPQIFRWYNKDFGSNQDILTFIADHLDESHPGSHAGQDAHARSLTYVDFDWSINATLYRPSVPV
ncbi:DUF547 domain-containing protein [Candidatus Entotheonella palauensis]|uniref:DUF547 domain-containing protein n=1 Tax=Candidatus Entotheonella palauensis TaxID=93172 RepID=UPI0015C4884A|nr:DUF547 domain-containing protein [Candidatus Entotheonella palauensis]